MNENLEEGKIPMPMVTTLKKLASGYINGTRVSFGNFFTFKFINKYAFYTSFLQCVPFFVS